MKWTRRKPQCTASGILGWVSCRQNHAAGDALPMDADFRVHVCRHYPCTAMYHPSKYGVLPAPLAHGKIWRTCQHNEILNLEAEGTNIRKQLSGDTFAPIPIDHHNQARKENVQLPSLALASASCTSAVAESQQLQANGADTIPKLVEAPDDIIPSKTFRH